MRSSHFFTSLTILSLSKGRKRTLFDSFQSSYVSCLLGHKTIYGKENLLWQKTGKGKNLNIEGRGKKKKTERI